MKTIGGKKATVKRPSRIADRTGPRIRAKRCAASEADATQTRLVIAAMTKL
jgi:hypothetical protein